MQFPLELDAFIRMPRHPDFKWELFGGVCHVEPRPRTVALRRATDLPVPAVAVEAEVRALDISRDRASVGVLLHEVWADSDLYKVLDAPDDVLGPEIARSLDGSGAELGAVAVDGGAVCAVALVAHGRDEAWTLEWLTVAARHRERGLATAMLAFLVGELRERGVGELRSGFSPSNRPSLLWHLSPHRGGFTLAPDPIREALRERP